MNLTELETRDNPSVTIYHGVVAPSPQGDPGYVVMYIQGDPQHVESKVIEPRGGPNSRIVVAA